MNEPDDPVVEEVVTEPAPLVEATPATPRFPWPPSSDDNVIAAAAETWRQSVFSPTDFFRAMPATGYKSALAYALPIGVIAAAMRLFWASLFDVLGLQFLNPWATLEPGPIERIIGFLLSPVFLVAWLFVFGAITHASLKLVRGTSRPFVTTFRVWAFSYGPALFGVVPVLGVLVAVIWTQFLVFFGLREAHQTSTGRVIAALLLPAFVLLFLLMLFVIFLVIVIGVSVSSFVS